MINSCRQKWDSRMSDRERFINQMHFKPVDRCFNMEFGYWDENFHTWDMFITNNIKNNQDADIFFNFDKIEIISGELWMHPLFKERVIQEDNDKKIIINQDGLLAELPLDNHETIPHFLRSSVVTPDDWFRIKKERFRIDDPARKINVDKLKAIYPADRDFPLGVDCGSMIGKIRDLLTFEGLAYACYDYPEMVDDMVETSCQLVEHALDQLLAYISFDFASGWEDIAFNTGPIVSPHFFSEIVMPRYKRIAAKLHAADIDIWYTDCDGNIKQLLPYFLEGGINTMFPFEVNSSGHPGKLLDIYGENLRIMGGVDKMVLGSGKSAIKDYLESIKPYVKRGGFIPFCDHRCPPNVKEEDYLYYLDLKGEMFGLNGY